MTSKHSLTEMQEIAYISAFKTKLNSYSHISDYSWNLIEAIISFKTIKKDDVILRNGETAKSIYFVCKGALRAYTTDTEGNYYTKNIFLESNLAGSTISYLLAKPSRFTIEALEDSIIIDINYKTYRQLIDTHDDLKNFYIAYLEKNWVIDKEPREVSLVMENAKERYLSLLKTHPNIDQRIPQMHLASHLGITPTQLSRIKKDLRNQ